MTPFFESYLRAKKLSEVQADAKKFPHSTVAGVFRNAYAEVATATTRVGNEARGDLKTIDVVERAVGRTIATETGKLGTYLPFLATTGNACPLSVCSGQSGGLWILFVGLVSVVPQRSPSSPPGSPKPSLPRRWVSPRPSPAVIFYNYFTNRTKGYALEMDAFGAEVVNIIERNYIR